MCKETNCQGPVAEYSPAGRGHPGLPNRTTHIVTVTINGDETEDVRVEPKPGDGEFGKVISLPKNQVLQRVSALVAKEHVQMPESVLCSGAAADKREAILNALPEI